MKIKNKIISFLKNDIVERCYKTFFQAFIGVILTASTTDLITTNALKTTIISAIIAGLSAIWNILKTVIDKNTRK